MFNGLRRSAMISHRGTAPEAGQAKGIRFLQRIAQSISARGLEIGLGAIVCALISAYALWYSSAGQFPHFPPVQNDYIALGQAFLHGQVSLLEQPNPQLAALPNPYDYRQRSGISFHFDASYYRGRYYLYWGPIPALVAAVWQALTGIAPSGPLLVVLPYIGLAAVFFAILAQISRYFPGHAASLSLGLFVLLGLANLPFVYILGKPRAYEAAIVYGQFFLMAGLLGWLTYVAKREFQRPAWLVIAGLSWGLAVGCRYNLAISVGIYLGFILVWLQQEASPSRLWRRAGLIAIPLGSCLAALALYNFVRFGNPLETGNLYQLTIPQLHGIDLSFSYMPSNLYMYLVYPLSRSSTFPFMQPPNFHPQLLPKWLSLPKHRVFDQDMVGLLSATPGVWMLALIIPIVVFRVRSAIAQQARPLQMSPKSMLFGMIALAAAGQFLLLTVFVYAAERYLIDFYASLALAVAMLVWQVDERLRPAGRVRMALWLVTVGLTIWTLGIYVLGSFAVLSLILPYFDSSWLAQTTAFWNDRYAGLQALFSATGGLVSRLFGVH